jgi:hypothetical protein
MKGQLIFEFVIATVLFIVIVFFVVITLNGTVSSFTGNFYKNHISEEAMRVSEQLTNSPGKWNNLGEPMLVGLAVEWPVLNDTKIKYLGGYCSVERSVGENKDILVRLLGLESRGGVQGLHVLIANASKTVMDCSTGQAYTEQGYAERFGYTNESGIVKIGVYVW